MYILHHNTTNFCILVIFHTFFTLISLRVKSTWNWKWKWTKSLYMGSMGIDHSNPYIHSLLYCEIDSESKISAIHLIAGYRWPCKYVNCGLEPEICPYGNDTTCEGCCVVCKNFHQLFQRNWCLLLPSLDYIDECFPLRNRHYCCPPAPLDSPLTYPYPPSATFLRQQRVRPYQYTGALPMDGCQTTATYTGWSAIYLIIENITEDDCILGMYMCTLFILALFIYSQILFSFNSFIFHLLFFHYFHKNYHSTATTSHSLFYITAELEMQHSNETIISYWKGMLVCLISHLCHSWGSS